MAIISPNPRRSFQRPIATDAISFRDGRKRQKLSHGAEQEPQNTNTTGGDMTRICKTQESSSSDQSASKWFRAAKENISSTQKAQTDLDGKSWTI